MNWYTKIMENIYYVIGGKIVEPDTTEKNQNQQVTYNQPNPPEQNTPRSVVYNDSTPIKKQPNNTAAVRNTAIPTNNPQEQNTPGSLIYHGSTPINKQPNNTAAIRNTAMPTNNPQEQNTPGSLVYHGSTPMNKQPNNTAAIRNTAIPNNNSQEQRHELKKPMALQKNTEWDKHLKRPPNSEYSKEYTIQKSSHQQQIPEANLEQKHRIATRRQMDLQKAKERGIRQKELHDPEYNILQNNTNIPHHKNTSNKQPEVMVTPVKNMMPPTPTAAKIPPLRLRENMNLQTVAAQQKEPTEFKTPKKYITISAQERASINKTHAKDAAIIKHNTADQKNQELAHLYGVVDSILSLDYNDPQFKGLGRKTQAAIKKYANLDIPPDQVDLIRRVIIGAVISDHKLQSRRVHFPDNQPDGTTQPSLPALAGVLQKAIQGYPRIQGAISDADIAQKVLNKHYLVRQNHGKTAEKAQENAKIDALLTLDIGSAEFNTLGRNLQTALRYINERDLQQKNTNNSLMPNQLLTNNLEQERKMISKAIEKDRQATSYGPRRP
jgi:hypothetical protein